MTYARYGIFLAVTTLIAGLLAAAAHAYWDIDYALPLTVGMIILLLLLSVAIFYLSKRTVGAANKFLFSNVFMGATMVKMFACGGLIGAYIVLGEPAGKMFIIPFFTSYFVFTLLEIICLVTIAGEAQEAEAAAKLETS
ncbi:hypothetical protein [Neolewinella antarctica]|uniref:Uncharacterized protein n=1 Tax=Neolewinella antarctica TaxID=442734 RepID=A0ABX0X9K6_9BACT|nr:hypothetical protein [Neolewinella antarctica]NJC25917.1 hypothetical protein [Neolewinella antarctica]